MFLIVSFTGYLAAVNARWAYFTRLNQVCHSYCSRMAMSELSLLRWPPHHYEAAAILKYKQREREYGTNETEMITILYRDTHTDAQPWVCVIYMSVLCGCVCECTLHISWVAKYFSWLRQLLLTQFRIVISLWFLLLHFIYALAIYRCCLPFEAGPFFYVASCLHMANVTIAIAAAASYELHCCIVKSWNKQPISEREENGRESERKEERERVTALSNGAVCSWFNWISELFISWQQDLWLADARCPCRDTFSMRGMHRLQ